MSSSSSAHRRHDNKKTEEKKKKPKSLSVLVAEDGIAKRLALRYKYTKHIIDNALSFAAASISADGSWVAKHGIFVNVPIPSIDTMMMRYEHCYAWRPSDAEAPKKDDDDDKEKTPSSLHYVNAATVEEFFKALSPDVIAGSHVWIEPKWIPGAYEAKDKKRTVALGDLLIANHESASKDSSHMLEVVQSLDAQKPSLVFMVTPFEIDFSLGGQKPVNYEYSMQTGPLNIVVAKFVERKKEKEEN